MSKPIGPGDKCIVVKALNPQNLGKLVLVVGTFKRGDRTVHPGETIPPGFSAQQFEGHEFDGVFIESLGSPLHAHVEVFCNGGFREVVHYRTQVGGARPSWLRRLDDGEDADVLVTDKTKEAA